MTTAEKKDNVIAPLLPKHFGLAEHKFRRFNAVVPPGLDKDTILDPTLWAMIAPQCRMGDEIRCIAEDNSFYALLFVSFSQGTDIRVELIHGTSLEDADLSEINDELNDYIVEQKGQLKFCIVKKSTGERIKEGIATKAQAEKELEEYRKILRR